MALRGSGRRVPSLTWLVVDGRIAHRDPVWQEAAPKGRQRCSESFGWDEPWRWQG